MQEEAFGTAKYLMSLYTAVHGIDHLLNLFILLIRFLQSTSARKYLRQKHQGTVASLLRSLSSSTDRFCSDPTCFLAVFKKSIPLFKVTEEAALNASI